jgi:hypothetical protein
LTTLARLPSLPKRLVASGAVAAPSRAFEKSAFVIMPFSATASADEREWTAIFSHVFRPAFEAAGYQCTRAAPGTGSLIKSIVEQLASATVVFADVTDQNPNVFYELGVRHALSRRTIIATQDQRFVPSDLRGYWNLQYGLKPSGLAQFPENLRSVLHQIESDPGRDDSPVSEFLDRDERALSRYAQREKLRKLTALRTELSAHVQGLEAMLAEDTLPFLDGYLPLDCLRLLLSTRYVEVGTDLLRQAYELERGLVRLSAGRFDRQQLRPALLRAHRLSAATLEIQRSIEAGVFVEPEAVSHVTWLPHLPAAKPRGVGDGGHVCVDPSKVCPACGSESPREGCAVCAGPARP